MTARPAVAAPADVVSDVLAAVRLTGGVLFTTRFSEPWSVWSPPGERIGPMILPSARCFAMFHVVTSGECRVDLDGLPACALAPMDVLVLPRGDAHTLSGATPTPTRTIAELLPPTGLDGFPEVVHGGGGATTRLVCGYLACDHRFNPLVSALPRVMRVGRDGSLWASSPVAERAPLAGRLAPDAASWFQASLSHALVELASSRTGGRAVLARLVELLFIQALRGCVEHAASSDGGWLGALADPRVGPALAALHGDPARGWSVDELARRAAVSRSVLAERFTALLGEPPMRYLARWRVQLATNLLAGTELGIAEIAARVGYDSEAAFTRMFHRMTGEPPSAVRQRRKGAGAGDALR